MLCLYDYEIDSHIYCRVSVGFIHHEPHEDVRTPSAFADAPQYGKDARVAMTESQLLRLVEPHTFRPGLLFLSNPPGGHGMTLVILIRA